MALSAEDAQRTIQTLVDSHAEWIIDGKYVCLFHIREQHLNLLSHWVQLKEISYNRATDILCRLQDYLLLDGVSANYLSSKPRDRYASAADIVARIYTHSLGYVLVYLCTIVRRPFLDL